MTIPRFRPINGLRHVPSYRFAAWAGWRDGQLRSRSTQRLHVTIRLPGDGDLERVRAAIDELLARHRVLGAAYYDRNGRPWVDFGARRVPPVAELRLGEMGPGDVQQHARKIATEFASAGFSLADPLIRVGILRLPAAEHDIIVSAHHLISDNVSIGLLSGELQALLAGRGKDGRLDDSAIDHGDYLSCIHEWLESEHSEAGRTHWRTLLPASAQELADPLIDGAVGLDAVRLDFRISGLLLQRLDEIARRASTTRFTVLLAAQHVVLKGLKGSDATMVVVVTDGREHPLLRTMQGYMADKIIYRAAAGPGSTFEDLVRDLHEQTVRGMPHRFFRYDRLVHEFWPEFVGRLEPPTFNFRRSSPSIRGQQGSPNAAPSFLVAPPVAAPGRPRANYNMDMTDRGDALVGRLTSSPKSATLVLQHLHHVLERASADSSGRVSGLMP